MLNVAIIGLGVMGKNHYRVLQKIKEAKIVALCDPFAKDEFSHLLYESVDAMLEAEEIDFAIIATPTFLHKEIALKCLEKNIHLLIEKPIASNVKDARVIQKEAKKRGLKVVVGHIERFNPVVETLTKEIENKEIYSINITRVGPFPPRIADVGILTDLSVHDIDLIRFITKKEILQKSIFKSKKIHNHHEDNAIISFRLEDEIISSITTNWLTPFKKRKIEVACKEAYYEADLMTQELLEFSNYKINNSYVTRGCFVKKSEPLLNELKSVIEYVKDDKQTIAASIEDSIKTLLLIEEGV
jgi:predicted dehydrogenase